MYWATCANPAVVDNWFDLYKEVLGKNDITSCLQIWNVAECGCVDCPKAKKVITVTRVRANQLCGGDKGETTTVLTFVNAAGLNTKPVVIHKGTKVMDTWKKGKPKGTATGASENGWITKCLFYKYGKAFIEYLKQQSLNRRKNLLLMDSHNSHTFNYEFMKLMNDNNIIVLALPSHTTQVLQPLDDVPFASFKNEWYEAVRLLVHNLWTCKIIKSEWFGVFVHCWKKAITIRNIQAGFRHTEICSVD